MTFPNMTGLKTSVFTLMAAAFALSAAMATPTFSQAQAAHDMKVAMAMPMHGGGKMVRHGKRQMTHRMAAKDTAKNVDRYGMK